MTSSATSTEGEPGGTPPRPRPPGIPLYLVILATAGVALVAGWGFILWHHHFHITASSVLLMLGWTAVLSTVYFLWRTADNTDLDDQTDWWKPTGRLDELIRQKKSLLKAIKESELDRDTGKLSQVDADEILGRYRKKAIEVIKQIDLMESTEGAGPIRARIEREVRARLEVERARDEKVKAKAPKPPMTEAEGKEMIRDFAAAVGLKVVEGPEADAKVGPPPTADEVAAMVAAAAAGTRVTIEKDDDGDNDEDVGEAAP